MGLIANFSYNGIFTTIAFNVLISLLAIFLYFTLAKKLNQKMFLGFTGDNIKAWLVSKKQLLVDKIYIAIIH